MQLISIGISFCTEFKLTFQKLKSLQKNTCNLLMNMAEVHSTSRSIYVFVENANTQGT